LQSHKSLSDLRSDTTDTDTDTDTDADAGLRLRDFGPGTLPPISL
jgi:hypothetical protein